MFEKMTGAFHILQYIFSIAYIVTDYIIFGVSLLVLILVTTIINYILLYVSYRKIKKMAEREMKVQNDWQQRISTWRRIHSW